jgi:hypothetical protein
MGNFFIYFRVNHWVLTFYPPPWGILNFIKKGTRNGIKKKVIKNHLISDYNGLTGVSTLAVNIAIKKGMTCVIASGNSGGGGISVPADAFYSITVGAVDSNKQIAYFSSRGPTYDQRIKPEVVAKGKDTTVVSPSNNNLYSVNSGTSFSTPLIAGAVSLILQVKPHLKPEQVYLMLRECSSNKNSPNNEYGYGIPDIEKCINLEDMEMPKKCKNECLNKGECYLEKCYCTSQFYGVDCSKNINEGFIPINLLFFIIERFFYLFSF